MDNQKRIDYIDVFRGLAIMHMLLYHLLYDLKYIFQLDMPFFSIQSWYYYQMHIVLSFIFISGASAVHSKKLIKNALRLLLLSLVITVATSTLMPSEAIYFGVLHFLSLAMLLLALYKKWEDILSKKFSLLRSKGFSLFMFFLDLILLVGYRGFFVKTSFYQSIHSFLMQFPFAFAFGFDRPDFSSADYVPLLPWILFTFCGYHFGRFLKQSHFDPSMDSAPSRFLKALGQRSLRIYLLHQPIFLALLYVIFSMTKS